MIRSVVRTLAGILLIPLAAHAFGGCGLATSTTASCTDTTHAASCAGTFPCGNSGIQAACDKATQVCSLQPGMVDCITIPGASASACPSFEAASAVAGCTPGLQTTCSGSSGDGITIECE